MRKDKGFLYVREITKLIWENKSISSISRILKISRTTIYKIIRLEELKLERKDIEERIRLVWNINDMEWDDYIPNWEKCIDKINKFAEDETMTQETLNRAQEKLDEIENDHERRHKIIANKIKELHGKRDKIDKEIEEIKRKYSGQ